MVVFVEESVVAFAGELSWVVDCWFCILDAVSVIATGVTFSGSFFFAVGITVACITFLASAFKAAGDVGAYHMAL